MEVVDVNKKISEYNQDGLENEINDLKRILRETCQNSQEMFRIMCEMNQSLQEEHLYVMQLNTIMDNLQYEILDPRMKRKSLFFPKIESVESTINKIVEEKRSIARFGDGEFSIMSGENRQKFQRLDARLAERLTQVISTDDDRILIGIANNYGNLNKYNKQAADEIRIYMTQEVRATHQKFLSQEKTYYDAYMSRPYVMMKENGRIETQKRFLNLKRIWDKRNVIIVEGSLTRMGMGNDLLKNAKSIRRILAPATNSFDRYEDILDKSLEVAKDKDNVLFLIAMGPAVGVLAYDLTINGFQAVDLGHVDLEYEWFLKGQGKRVPIKNKYNNEVIGGDVVETTELSEDYIEQIVAKFE